MLREAPPGAGPNRDRWPYAGHAGAARRCTKQHRQPWAPTGTTGRGGYASTHAHLGTTCRGTRRELRAASGPEELSGHTDVDMT